MWVWTCLCRPEINAAKPRSGHNADISLLSHRGKTVEVVHCTQEPSCTDRWSLASSLHICPNQGPWHNGYPLGESTLLFYFFFNFLKFIYLGGGGERERVHTSRWEAESRRYRISSRLHAINKELHVGLELTNHKTMTWAEIESQTLNPLRRPGTLRESTF